MSLTKYFKGIGKQSIFGQKLPNKVVKCLACYHKCELEENHRGICGIRHNYKGELYSLVNTMPCSTCLDPIEKKPLYHFYPGTSIYSIGTTGCNMRCSFCQNWQISQTPKGSNLDLEDVAKNLFARRGQHTPEMAVMNAIKNGCNSIAYTYNEPTVFADYIFETAKLANSKGVKNVLVTNGYQSIECISKLNPYIDAVNIDLKTINNSFYSRLCGVRIKPILRNIAIWHALGVWVELTTLLIPGENDTIDEMNSIAKFIASIDTSIVWHISAYRDAYRMNGKGRTPKETLVKAYEIGKKHGLEYIYCGNVVSDKHSTTYCHHCGIVIVKRGYWGRGGKIKNLNEFGKCKKCNTKIPGIWTDKAVNLYTGKKVHNIPKELYEIKVMDPIDIDNGKKNVQILFATQTGVCEEYAKELKKEGDKIIGAKYNINVIDMEEYNEINLHKESHVIIITSTYFYGRIPRNGERFYSFVKKLGKNSLKDVKFAIIGIGSTGTRKEHLKTYQVIARELDVLFEKLGGTRIRKIVELNKRKDFISEKEFWKSAFWKSI